MKLKVLLINPPYPFEECPTPPLGLMSLAAYLLANDIEARIEDYIIKPYSKTRIKEVLNEYNPDFVGATGVTMNIKKSLNILKDCKDENTDVVTVIGGPHVTFDADAILLDNPYIDCIVRGEGEITFLDLIQRHSNKKPLDDVQGISFREGKRIIHNENRPLIKDINILPFPARHLVQLSKYKALGFPLNTVTSRGCPHRCIFCVGRRMSGSKMRYFSVSRVVDEFEILASMGFKQINIADDLFTADEKRCMAICDQIIKRGIEHKWNAFSRVDTISKDLLLRLKEAGCSALCFGIESGDQGILDTAKKKTTLKKIREAVDLCLETGMEPMASYIMGLPGETSETIERSLKFAAELCPNYGFHILAPFPGTELREKAEEYGMEILTNDWDQYDANRPVCGNGTISPEEINTIAQKFNNSFKDYVNDLIMREKAGHWLSEKDRSYMDNLHMLGFSLHLILNESVEKYSGLNNGCSDYELKHDFLRFFKYNTNTNEVRPGDLLERLFNLNCLKIFYGDTKKTIIWDTFPAVG